MSSCKIENYDLKSSYSWKLAARGAVLARAFISHAYMLGDSPYAGSVIFIVCRYGTCSWYVAVGVGVIFARDLGVAVGVVAGAGVAAVVNQLSMTMEHAAAIARYATTAEQ